MSVLTLIMDRGVDVTVKRPAFSRGSDGSSIKTWAVALTARAFVQPSGGVESKREGRMNLRNSATIYFAGAVDIRIEDQIFTPTSGKASVYSVTGVSVPDELNQRVDRMNIHTIVAAEKAMPLETA